MLGGAPVGTPVRGITTDAARPVNSFRLLCSTNWRGLCALRLLQIMARGLIAMGDRLDLAVTPVHLSEQIDAMAEGSAQGRQS